MTPAATRLGFKTSHDTKKGPIKSHVELDFFAKDDPNIQPRLRHAYLTHQAFLVGQTTTLFLDEDATGDMVDANGVAGFPRRQAQIRATYKAANGLETALSFERPFTDTVETSGNGDSVNTDTPSQNAGISTRSGHSQPSVPDAVLALKYTTSWGHIGVRGLARDLRVKYLSYDPDTTTNAQGLDFKARTTGYGVGVSTNVNVCAQGRVFGQYNVGRGIGHYIPDAAGYSAYIDSTHKKFEALRLSHYLVGFEWKWTPEVRSNVMYNDIHITGSRHMPATVKDFNKKMQEVIVNTFVSPLPKTDIGLEYAFVERKSQTNHKGVAHRVQMVVMYTF
jgi:hypothetical protein